MGLDQRETEVAPPASRIAPVIPAEHRRFPLLDPMRALAAISILGVHATLFAGTLEDRPFYGGLLAHLDIGVPFFFVLSAFLLYRPFVEARVRGRDRTSFASYGVRRFARIAPAYWAALTIAAIVPGIAGAFSGNWWVYYGLLQNYPVYTPDSDCVADPFRCGISTTWSLALEVFFYALLPLFVLAMAWLAKRWRGRNWLVPELIAVGVLSAISFVIQSRVPQGDISVWLFFSPLGRGWWFGLGLGLAAISVWVRQQEREPALVRWVRTRPSIPVLIALTIFLVSCLVILTPGPSLAFPVVWDPREPVRVLRVRLDRGARPRAGHLRRRRAEHLQPRARTSRHRLARARLLRNLPVADAGPAGSRRPRRQRPAAPLPAAAHVRAGARWPPSRSQRPATTRSNGR